MKKFGAGNESNRRSWIESELRQLPPGGRILDAGAGEQQYKAFCPHLRYVSQDFAQYDGRGDGVGLQTGKWDQTKLDLICDISAIPEPDASFDAVLCAEVFEHLPNPLPSLREFARLLRPGGRLILTAPFASFTHFAPYHFATGFNRYFYETHLPEQGFQIADLQANGNYFEYVAQEVRRIRTVAKRYSSSRMRPWERLAAGVLLRMLARAAKLDHGSSEFANFGFHVRAVRL